MSTQAAGPRVIRLKKLTERLGLSRSTIYDRMNPKSPRHDVTFPRPINLGGRAIGWIDSEITDWIEIHVQENVRG
ncbi:AlpA family phage regulatory protein [Halopseudomonas pelagia]|uniref:AlpA family phage regulatory protein n=1 Tax=Halopseudomonas pelagia TaxID=553151 RepID=UPI0030DC194F